MKIIKTRYELRILLNDGYNFIESFSEARLDEAKKQRFIYRSKFPNDTIELFEIQETEKMI